MKKNAVQKNERFQEIAKTPLSGIKSGEERIYFDSFSKIPGSDGTCSTMNVELLPSGMRSHAKLVRLNGQNVIGDVKAMRVCGGKLLVLTDTLGTLKSYVYENGSFIECCVLKESCSQDFDADVVFSETHFTSDSSPHIIVGSADDKILFFPAGRYAALDAHGRPYAAADVPTEMPRFEHAAIVGGRIFGNVAQTLYVSGINGCFDWQYDSGDAVDPKKAFRCQITSSTDRDMPVKALVSYRGNVLIFRENAVQKVIGEGNPYSVKEFIGAGCDCRSSIAEVEGKLFFISGGKPRCLDGSRLRALPPLPSGMTAGSCGVSFGGNYCFSAEKNGEGYLLTYSEKASAYGILSCGNLIRGLSCTSGGLYLMTDTGEGRELWFLSDDRTDVPFTVEFELFKDRLAIRSLTGLALIADMSREAYLQIDALLYNDAGDQTQTSVGSCMGNGGTQVFRFRGKLKRCAYMRLRINGFGDATLRSMKAVCRKERWKES